MVSTVMCGIHFRTRAAFVLKVVDVNLEELLKTNDAEALRERWTTALRNQVGDPTLNIYGLVSGSVVILGDVDNDKEMRLLECEGTSDLTIEGKIAYVAVSPPPALVYGNPDIKKTFKLEYCWNVPPHYRLEYPQRPQISSPTPAVSNDKPPQEVTQEPTDKSSQEVTEEPITLKKGLVASILKQFAQGL